MKISQISKKNKNGLIKIEQLFDKIQWKEKKSVPKLWNLHKNVMLKIYEIYDWIEINRFVAIKVNRYR